MSFFQNIYGVFFRPSDTFKSLNINYSPSILIQAAIILLIVNLISQGLSLTSVLSSIVNWFFFASLFFLTAYIFVLSGKDYWKTLSTLAFTNLPLIFFAPLDILSATNSLTAALLRLVISIWIFNLSIIAISELCAIPKKKALLLYLIPMLVITYLAISFIASLVQSIAIMI
jgi:hypothetical protein